jgi:hypothetical protein
MVAHTDAKTSTHPQKKKRNRKIKPTEHEEGGDGADVEKNHRNRGKPIHRAVAFGGQKIDLHGFRMYHYFLNLAGVWLVICKTYVIPEAPGGFQTLPRDG